MLAARDPWYPPERIRLPDLPIGVDDAAAAELLRQRAPELVPPVAAAIAQAAAGNPLALVELPATLTAGEGERGVTALELPLGPGGRLQRAFAGRVEALSGPARQALLVAAAYAEPSCPSSRRRAGRPGPTPVSWRTPRRRGWCGFAGGEVTFAHPLIRGLVYSEAGAGARRAAHAALAGVLRDDDDHQAWHLAAATSQARRGGGGHPGARPAAGR